MYLSRPLKPTRAPIFCFLQRSLCAVCRQCPGTTIERNFEVGTSLSVSVVVNGSTALTPLCDHSSSTSSGSSAASGSSCQQYSTSAGADNTPARGGRRLRSSGEGNRFPSSPISSETNHRLLQEGDQSTNATFEHTAGGGESWSWDEDGPTFALGELSRVRLASHILLLDDGGGEAWTPLRNTSSASAAVAGNGDEEEDGRAGVITASLKSFGVQEEAVFSTLLFFSRVEAVEEASGGGEGILGDSEWHG